MDASHQIGQQVLCAQAGGVTRWPLTLGNAETARTTQQCRRSGCLPAAPVTAAAVAAAGWPVVELWNGCLVPAVDGVKQIGWLQAWGLQFLINMLFKVSIVNKKG